MSLDFDARKLMILSTIVDEYLKTGEPVGSKTILTNSQINYSSATIRNEMAYLEKIGLLEQPHTSAGRIPTYIGYRLYISQLMKPHLLSDGEMHEIDMAIMKNGHTVETVLSNAVEMLSDLTQLTVVNKNNIFHYSMITRVEVIPAGRRLYALLMITSTGGVKNKVCRLEFDLTNQEINFFENFVNENLKGVNVDRLTPQMLEQLAIALGSYIMSLSPLLYAVYELSEEFSNSNINISGQENMLVCSEIDITQMMRFLNEKTEIARLLSNVFDDVEIIFGKEKDVFAISNSSMIVSPYKLKDEVMGSMGVIGPLRLDYANFTVCTIFFGQLDKKINTVAR